MIRELLCEEETCGHIEVIIASEIWILGFDRYFEIFGVSALVPKHFQFFFVYPCELKINFVDRQLAGPYSVVAS